MKLYDGVSKRSTIVVIAIVMVVIAGLIGFILIREGGEFQQSTTSPFPSPTTSITTSPKPTKLSLRIAQPTKTAVELPVEYLPKLYSWTLWRGGANSDRMYPASLPRSLKVIYRINVSANIHGVLAEPLIEDNFIYLADDSGIYALNRSSGELVWGVEIYDESTSGRSTKYPQPVWKWRALGLYRFTVAYGLGEYVYVATTSYLDVDNAYILALDKKSGDVIWRVELEPEHVLSSIIDISSNLIVADGKVFVGSVGDGYVFCVSEDGKLVWRTRLGSTIEGIAYGDGILYAMASKLYAVDVEDGKILWYWDYGSWPISKNGKVILEHYGRVAVLSTEGELLWMKEYGAGSNVEGYPYMAVGSQAIYVTRELGERPRDLYIVDMNGSILGKYQILYDEDSVAPIASNDVIVLPVKSEEGNGYCKLYILWSRGEKLSEIVLDVRDKIWYPIAVAAYGEVYVVTDPYTLYRLGDNESPRINNVSVKLSEDYSKLIIYTEAYDNESALYRVTLVYSVNGSEWMYKDMDISRTYVTEPIGGYGYREELYEIALDVAPDTSIEFYIVAVDNVGNYVLSNVYAYEVVEE